MTDHSLPEPFKKVNILIVDDDPKKILVLRTILADVADIRIAEATSGEEALRYLLNNDTALILLDVNMPGMDGFETAQLIRQRPSTHDTPIIFVTAISTAEIHIMKGYSLGAVDYVLTPVVPDILKAKVRVFVELYQKRWQLERYASALTETNLHLQHQLNEIEQLNRDLQISNEELESFSYSVAHDLGAPIRHVDAFAQLFLQSYSGKLDEKGRLFIEKVLQASDTLKILIADMLRLSKLTRQKPEMREVDLGKIALDIFKDLQQSQPERKARCEIAQDIIVNGDTGLWHIALENLIGNAWKYSGKKPETVIEFSHADLYGREAYFIRDNGAGFDSSRAENLFMPFRRFHSAESFPGTGIGLAIVNRIVRKHGGRIWAESEVDKGATFYFTVGMT